MFFTNSSKTLLGIKFALCVICTAASVEAATILKKRITAVMAAAGAVFFFGAAYGAKKIANVACTPEAQAALCQAQWADSAAGCLGWSASAIILAAAGAAFAVAGGGNWNWMWENAGVAAGISSRGLAFLATLILVLGIL